VTAFELLGKDYRYKTEFAISRSDNSSFYILPSGDPTFGSYRWNSTQSNEVLMRIIKSIPKKIKEFSFIAFDNNKWDMLSIPDGWIWQDIANYYGVGSEKLNWRENQYDIVLKSGDKIGDKVEIVETKPGLVDYELSSIATSAGKGTGDNAYIYFSPGNKQGFVKGTIPVNQNRFIVSGSYPSSSSQFIGELLDTFMKTGLSNPMVAVKVNKYNKVDVEDYDVMYTHFSPSLDSIIYWFNRKSINLYGEALIKTFAYEKKGFGSTDSGVAIVKHFWKQKGLDEDELNIGDGSGLSPQNRVTTHAQVEILKYAKTKDWFPHFYNSLPEYNSMIMKSGTIKDVKGYCGYHKAKDGTEYVFSFLVNNYNGSSSGLVNKMYKVLDVLK
jgi:serine-type D-Ala-D-Ala carboxypeptidase/endopeptidase (penicillin-binding protein 4)